MKAEWTPRKHATYEDLAEWRMWHPKGSKEGTVGAACRVFPNLSIETILDWMRRYDGQLTVWCDWAEAEAVTVEGHCQFCGKRDHEKTETDWIEGGKS